MSALRKCAVYTMKYYLAIKKNEIMTFAGKLMYVDIFMLSKFRFRETRFKCGR
jgi:hypothetical protein